MSSSLHLSKLIATLKNRQLLLVSIFYVFFLFETCAQGKYKLVSSKVQFFSEAFLENIEAFTHKTMGVIDFTNNKFAFKIPNDSFTFKKSLMQEHFNENYMESEKYPHSVFTGTIEGKYNLKKDGEYKVIVSGNLQIHAVTKKRTFAAIIKVLGEKTSITSSFKVPVADHKIKIPTVVSLNIAEIVEVKVSADLKRM